MADIYEVYDHKRPKESSNLLYQVTSSLKSALIQCNISTEVAKNIESFTISIFV